jgi:hypothetical protein
MTKLTFGIAAALIILGVSTYAVGVDGKHSVTALIPAFTGALLLIAGLIALKPALKMHGMHVAVLVGLLGFIAAIGGLIARRPTGLTLFSMLTMAVLTGLFVLLCVRSFVNARRLRTAGGTTE